MMADQYNVIETRILYRFSQTKMCRLIIKYLNTYKNTSA